MNNQNEEHEETLENFRPEEVLKRLRKSIADSGDAPTGAEPDNPSGQIEHLLDSSSLLEFEPLVEIAKFSDDTPLKNRLIVGTGTVNGRQVSVAAFPDFDDRRLKDSSARKLNRLLDRANKFKTPVILLLNSAQMQPDHDISDLSAWTKTFKKIVESSDSVPLISLFFSEICRFTSLFSPLSDFTLGLAGNTCASSELDLLLETPGQLIEAATKLLNYLPDTAVQTPFILDGKSPGVSSPLDELVPSNKSQPYDVKKLIGAIVDEDSFLELQPGFARNFCTGLARINGQSIGVLANQPKQLAGGLDPAAAEKATRFVKSCEKFNLALLRLVDQPGLIEEKSDAEIVPYYRVGNLFKALSNLPQ